MRWKVEGADKVTGAERSVFVDAASHDDAIARASGLGLMASHACVEPGNDRRFLLFLTLLIVAAVLSLHVRSISRTIEKGKTFKGKPESEWLALLDDRDSDTVATSVEAIAAIGGHDDLVWAKIESPSAGHVVRFAGISALWDLERNRSEKNIRNWLKSSDDRYSATFIIRNLRMKDRSVFLPDLEQSISSEPDGYEKDDLIRLRNDVADNPYNFSR